MENFFGLVKPPRVPVPLQSVEVEVDVKDHVATVVSMLLYQNKEENPIETAFVFPMLSEAAICHFSAKVGEMCIVSEVMEKEQALKDYDDALSSGQQAFVLVESYQSPDIFSIRVGNLPPGESASIRLEYVTEMEVQADEGLRFCLPAVLNPRYQPAGTESSSVTWTSMPSSQVPYDLSFSAQFQSPRPITKVESNCTMDPLKFLSQDQTAASVRLAAGHKFNRDVELLIYYKDTHEPSAMVEAGQAAAENGSLMGDLAIMLSLYPEFPKDLMSSASGEFVFLLDRSGSMSGSHMSSARDTLLLLLKSLPTSCFFNIYSFGSKFKQIFPKSVEYNQKTMKEALKKVEKMKANLGGTEILAPLKHIYSQSCIPNQPRQVFVLTDGRVTNTKEVINLVKSNSSSHRCFSFGIGEGASSALINGLAKEGGGHAQFITGSNRMQPKVIQSLRFAMQPAVVDISVQWDMPEGVSATVLSPPPVSLFHGQRSLLYAQLTGQSKEAAEGCVTVKYSLAGRPNENKLNFSLKPSGDTGLTVHRLGARSQIRFLEQELQNQLGSPCDVRKKKIIDLSVQSGVSSSFTAFIAINKSSGIVIQGPLMHTDFDIIGRMHLRQYEVLPLISDVKKSKPKTFSFPKLSFKKKSKQCAAPVAHTDYLVPEEASGEVGDFGALPQEGARNPVDHVEARSYREEPDPLLELVSLQKASGCWELDSALAKAVGKTSRELQDKQPSMANKEVWATILALVWLHGIKADARDEWELLAKKAVTWLRSQNATGIAEYVDAGCALLGCTVQSALGL